MLLSVAGEDIRQPRLDAHPDQRQQPLLLPPGGALELIIAQLDAAAPVWFLRMRRRQGHRHVEVVAARPVGGVEDRLIEEGFDGVENQVDLMPSRELNNGPPIPGVEARRRKFARLVELLLDLPQPPRVDVGQHHLLQPGLVLGDDGDGFPDAPRPDEQDSHTRSLRRRRIMRRPALDGRSSRTAGSATGECP